ncbi:hypothetical protein AMJ49_01335 [Parcubacteria bacterium DG_74_2]|nr:MAG: hypothetical protein AMJ49_01335 [Parcubacteria bacterium DG_74_2]
MILRTECPCCQLGFIGSDDPLGFQKLIQEAVEKRKMTVIGKCPRCGWEGIIAKRDFPPLAGTDYEH